MAFRGQYEHSLDAKDRITIPARFRAELAGGVVLAQGLEPCVEVFSEAAYSDVEDRFLSDLNPFDREGRRTQRRFHARSEDEKLDSAGRVRLPKRLVDHAGLEGGCVIAGVMNRLEIWNPERWAAENDEIDADEDARASRAGGGGAPGATE
ncbi:MAG: division/cell wall cluster transcriptional repressor MraZ [Solirubrobacterales bacterium]